MKQSINLMFQSKDDFLNLKQMLGWTFAFLGGLILIVLILVGIRSYQSDQLATLSVSSVKKDIQEVDSSQKEELNLLNNELSELKQLLALAEMKARYLNQKASFKFSKALLDLAQVPTKEVWVHHIQLNNKTKRWVLEGQAGQTKRITAWLDGLRNQPFYQKKAVQLVKIFKVPKGEYGFVIQGEL